jgi:hypothetical protein
MLAVDVEVTSSGALSLAGWSWDGVRVEQAEMSAWGFGVDSGLGEALEGADVVVMHNAEHDLAVLAKAGFLVDEGKVMCTQVAAHVLHSDLDVGLNDAVGATLIGEWSFHKALGGAFKEWAGEWEACQRVWCRWVGKAWQRDERWMARFYNRCDVMACWRLARRQQELLEAR